MAGGSAGSQVRSGQVLAAADENSLGPQRRTARCGGQPRGFLLASLPPISTSSCILLCTCLPRYVSRPVNRCCKTGQYKYMPSHIYCVLSHQVYELGQTLRTYEGTGRWLAPGEMKMGTSLDSLLCTRHDDRWRVGSAQSVPSLGFQASLLSGAPRPSPRPCSPPITTSMPRDIVSPRRFCCHFNHGGP